MDDCGLHGLRVAMGIADEADESVVRIRFALFARRGNLCRLGGW
jgi:hypothetical protein